jgi:Protein of unknown function (DUF4058)
VKSPFPGMDPYLEQHWRDLHARLIIYSCDQLQGQLPADLYARVEERIVLESDEVMRQSRYPDVRVVEHPDGGLSGSAVETGIAVAEPVRIHYGSEPITETYLEIMDAGTGKRVVTVIEFLSTSNKFPGESQDQYQQKQKELKQGRVSLAEIDLLRAGRRLLSIPVSSIPVELRTTYQVCVRRGWEVNIFEIYRVPLSERLPTIRIPLRERDADARLDLQALIDQAYRNGRYQTIDYKVPPEPPLETADAAWAEELLRQAGKH